MDWNKLQHTLFALDPTDPAEDLRKLKESAGAATNVAPTKDYVVESVEVAQGSMPVEGNYSIADFAALAGITLTEAQKTGSAGQLKGKDAIKKQPAGTTKNPTRDKLVGEADNEKSAFKKGLDWGKDPQNFNNVNAFKGGSKSAQGKDNNMPKSKSNPASARKSPTATNITSWRGFLQQHTAQLQQIASDPKKKAEFDKFMARMGESVKSPQRHIDEVESIKEMLYRKLNNKN